MGSTTTGPGAVTACGVTGASDRLLNAHRPKRSRDSIGPPGAERRDTSLSSAISRHANSIRKTCLRVLGNASDAEDAMQTTFLRYLEQGGCPRCSPGGWLHRVAIRVCLKQKACRRRRHAREQAAAACRRDRQERTGQLAARYAALMEALEELQKFIRLAYRKFYLRPDYIMKWLFKIGDLSELMRVSLAATQVLSFIWGKD